MCVHVCGSQGSTSVFLRSHPSCFFLHLKKFAFIYIMCTCECVSGDDITAVVCGVNTSLSHIPISLSTCLWETALSFHHVGSGIKYRALGLVTSVFTRWFMSLILILFFKTGSSQRFTGLPGQSPEGSSSAALGLKAHFYCGCWDLNSGPLYWLSMLP